MKNMKVSQKLIIGFGFILLSICILGAFTVLEKGQAADQALEIVEKNIPEILVTAQLREAFNSAYLGMRTYRLTRDTANYSQIQGDFSDAEKALQQLTSLVQKYPDLAVLKQFIAEFDGVYDRYVSSVQTSHNTLLEFLKNQKSLESFEKVIQQNVAAVTAFVDKEMDQARQAQDAAKLDMLAQYLGATMKFNSAIDAIRLDVVQAINKNDEKKLMETHKLLALIIQQAQTDKEDFSFEALKKLVDNVLVVLMEYDKILETMAKSITDLNALSSERSAYSKQIHTLVNTSFNGLSREINTQQMEAVDGLKTSQTSTVLFIVALLLVGIAFATYLTKSITGPLNKGMQFAQAVAAGNLDEELHVDSKDELGKLADALRSMVSSLKENISLAQNQAENASRLSQEANVAMQQAQEAQAEAERAKRQGMLDAAAQLEGVVEAVFSASRDLSAQVAESGQSVSESSDRITETASAMEEMNSTVLEVARSAGDATHVSNDARSKAEGGAHIVRDMVKRIAEVESQSQQLKDDMVQLGQQAESIGAIMNVISDIADQTNLLALNAAIEAARAGEAGRGFAVVADEVRKLAEKTMQATVEVGSAIAGVQTSVERNMKSVDSSVSSIEAATGLAQDAGHSLEEIVSLVDASADQVRTIATAAEEQSATSEEINRSLTSINTASVETSRAMNEATHAVMNLTEQAERLEQIIREMKNS